MFQSIRDFIYTLHFPCPLHGSLAPPGHSIKRGIKVVSLNEVVDVEKYFRKKTTLLLLS